MFRTVFSFSSLLSSLSRHFTVIAFLGLFRRQDRGGGNRIAHADRLAKLLRERLVLHDRLVAFRQVGRVLAQPLADAAAPSDDPPFVLAPHDGVVDIALQVLQHGAEADHVRRRVQGVREGVAKHLRRGAGACGRPPAYPPPLRRQFRTAKPLDFVVGRAAQLPDVGVKRARKMPHHGRHAHRGHEKRKVRQPRVVPVDARIGELDRRVGHVADGVAAPARLAPEPSAVFHGVEHHHVLVEPPKKGVESAVRPQQAPGRTSVRQPDSPPL